MDVDGTPAPARKVPISLEELIKKKEQEKQEQEKVYYHGSAGSNLQPSRKSIGADSSPTLVQPKFMTKEQRAQLALERRAKEVEAQRAVQDQERQQRAEFDAKARTEVHDNNRYGYDSRINARDRNERNRAGRSNGDWRQESTDTPSSAASGVVLADKEIELVKVWMGEAVLALISVFCDKLLTNIYFRCLPF